MLQHAAGAGGSDPLSAEVVLDCQRNTCQGWQSFSSGAPGVDTVRICPGPLGSYLEIGVNGGINRLDAGQMVIGEFTG